MNSGPTSKSDKISEFVGAAAPDDVNVAVLDSLGRFGKLQTIGAG